MVGEVNKIILNTLLSRGGIWLPDVGTLHIKRLPATMNGKRMVVPPHISVDYSSHNSSPSLVDIIAETASVEIAAAEDIYRRWLNKCRSGVELNIEGVGMLKNKSFIPCEELMSALNGIYGSNVTLRRGGYTTRVAVTVVAVLAIILCVYLFVAVSQDNRAESRVDVPAVVVQMSEISEVAEPESEPVNEEDVTPEEVVDDADKQADEVVADAVKDGYRHYVVYGSYSTRDNAQRAIVGLESKNEASECEIIELGRLYAVVLFSSPDRAECEQFIRSNRTAFPEAWIHSPRRR